MRGWQILWRVTWFSPVTEETASGLASCAPKGSTDKKIHWDLSPACPLIRIPSPLQSCLILISRGRATGSVCLTCCRSSGHIWGMQIYKCLLSQQSSARREAPIPVPVNLWTQQLSLPQNPKGLPLKRLSRIHSPCWSLALPTASLGPDMLLSKSIWPWESFWGTLQSQNYFHNNTDSFFVRVAFKTLIFSGVFKRLLMGSRICASGILCFIIFLSFHF